MRGWRFAIALTLMGAVLVAAGWPGNARSGSSEKAVAARDGLTAVFVPAGALDRPTRVTAEALDAERLPAAPAGSRLLGAGRFGPHGLRFAIPARITLTRNMARLSAPGGKTTAHRGPEPMPLSPRSFRGAEIEIGGRVRGIGSYAVSTWPASSVMRRE